LSFLHAAPAKLTINQYAPSLHTRPVEPLADALQWMKRGNLVVNAKLQHTWLREYQVLPNRTHPHMMMCATGGFLLHGVKVAPLATLDVPSWTQQPYVQRGNAAAPKASNGRGGGGGGRGRKVKARREQRQATAANKRKRTAATGGTGGGGAAKKQKPEN
jgi:hypothetical protein